MATSADYADYVLDQVAGLGAVRKRLMFGEYMVYVNDKPLLLVCDNTVFVKKHEAILGLMKGAQTGFPYPGAKEHYVLDIDDKALCEQVVSALIPLTPLPKMRKRKGG